MNVATTFTRTAKEPMMTNRRTDEELLEGHHLRRMKQEDRFLAKLDRQIAAAEAMIGTLIRNGKEVFYTFPQDGRYREGRFGELTDFLIRNKYA